MSIQNILGSTSNAHRNLMTENKGTVKKWEKTGLLEGIKQEYEKQSIAVLLENQAKQLIDESSRTGTAAGSEEWAGVALPLVRRIFSEIAAKDFVSVQPMNLPSGLIFYLDFKYGTGQPGFTTGSGKNSQADSVFGVTETANQASGGLYGAGRFGYSVNDAVTAGLSTGSLSATTYVSASAGIATTIAAINYDTAFSASLL